MVINFFQKIKNYWLYFLKIIIIRFAHMLIRLSHTFVKIAHTKTEWHTEKSDFYHMQFFCFLMKTFIVRPSKRNTSRPELNGFKLDF